MLRKEDLLQSKHLDISEIDGYSIIDIYNESDDCDEDSSEQCIEQENCTICYYSDGQYCAARNINICKSSSICWSYRDCFTMRTSCDFQDDNDTY